MSAGSTVWGGIQCAKSEYLDVPRPGTGGGSVSWGCWDRALGTTLGLERWQPEATAASSLGLEAFGLARRGGEALGLGAKKPGRGARGPAGRDGGPAQEGKGRPGRKPGEGAKPGRRGPTGDGRPRPTWAQGRQRSGLAGGWLPRPAQGPTRGRGGLAREQPRVGLAGGGHLRPKARPGAAGAGRIWPRSAQTAIFSC